MLMAYARIKNGRESRTLMVKFVRASFAVRVLLLQLHNRILEIALRDER